MKKLTAIVPKNNGTQKEVFVLVDNRTAEMLAQVGDKKLVNDYLVEEYRLYMSDHNEHRNTQSLDKSLDNGFDIEDENQNLLETVVQDAEQEKVRKAIKMLEPQQQWLVYQIFYKQRTRVDIAKELGIDESAVRRRLERIIKKIKKFFN